MAGKRMFSKQVLLSDAFLDMSAEARALYVTLNMCADDDGLVNNTKSLMRVSGASKEHLEELESNNFIHVFESGVCVIMHWKVHNTIKNDRYVPSLLDEKNGLSENEKKVYEIRSEILDPQGRLDKKSIEKIKSKEGEERKEKIDFEKTNKESPRVSAPVNDEIDEDVFDCAETAKAGYGPYRNVMLTDDEFSAWKDECPQADEYINLMSNYLKSKGESYADCLAALRSWYLRDCRKRENSADSQFAAPLTASHSGASYDLERVKANSLKVPEYVKRNKEKSPAPGDV
ncbi:MAG: hypothetical protein IK097_03670 [Clostridia bacterium]|nr:hypothetical protein [Clostridia bacterium]